MRGFSLSRLLARLIPLPLAHDSRPLGAAHTADVLRCLSLVRSFVRSARLLQPVRRSTTTTRTSLFALTVYLFVSFFLFHCRQLNKFRGARSSRRTARGTNTAGRHRRIPISSAGTLGVRRDVPSRNVFFLLATLAPPLLPPPSPLLVHDLRSFSFFLTLRHTRLGS